MKKTIELKEVCVACLGTGLYTGMGERCGAAVICKECQGTGCFLFKHTYEDFTTRRLCPGVKRVYECNPGITVGESPTLGIKLEDFGGVPYEDWLHTPTFPQGTEMRKYVCPRWWWQTKPAGSEFSLEKCNYCWGVSFSSCPHFADKENCWKEYDKHKAKEHNNEKASVD